MSETSENIQPCDGSEPKGNNINKNELKLVALKTKHKTQLLTNERFLKNS